MALVVFIVAIEGAHGRANAMSHAIETAISPALVEDLPSPLVYCFLAALDLLHLELLLGLRRAVHGSVLGAFSKQRAFEFARDGVAHGCGRGDFLKLAKLILRQSLR